MFLELNNVQKKYDNNIILDNITFNVAEGEIVCILGPSGCGKTTLLNMIGGFTSVDKGEIILDGEDITKISAETRNVATVFQSYGLFNHMTVFENIAYGLKKRKRKKDEIIKLVKNIVEIVGLENQENKYPNQLSGGQKQRVALARSLVIEPKLLLLDEPFSNLDKNLRDVMRKEVKKLAKYFNVTIILVTHDQEDAFSIADKVILLHNGKIVQQDKPENIYNKPKSRVSLDFIGKANILSEEYYVRPERVVIVEKSNIKCTIKEVNFKGSFIEYIVKTSDNNILSIVELNNGANVRKVNDEIFIIYEQQQFSKFKI